MTFDDATRARIARGWASTSLDQRAYAAQHGISTRTLRQYITRFGVGRRPQAQLRAAIVASIEQLQAVLAALDAEAAADSAAEPEGGLQLEHQVERHAVSARLTTPARAEPLASTPKVHDAGRPAEVLRAPAVRGNEAAGDVLEVAGSAVAAAEHVVPVVDGAGPAGASCRPVAGSAADQHGQRPLQENGRPGVVDIEALRKRAAQLRAARAATGAPTRSSFDWGAE